MTAVFDRSQRHYKSAKAEFRRECEDLHAECWLCFEPINYSLPSGHPESFSVDHAKTVKDHPELGDDPANFRPSHLLCNQRRGDDEPHIDIGEPSEDW
ncbi:hypothetical protein BN970_05062 [Mycolicibacterium conceptionense]|uniref:HNH endonuclease n=1 Tax=Mycolicibacterium conceptionense TaxID=451644 RepID=A0A0U1DUX2_9MYCO|nr:hypothetical protein [Mycolicibacterium conceptionense]ORV29061.1 hypothetical protein AWB98_06635 [Mycolicibacterium conceptionense]CQD21596.1 hypothetical protein BN970_05062 [Mycolicibacterium conceptionense]